MLKRSLTQLTFALAIAATAAMAFDVPAARASGGNAPWCAVVDYGDGDVSWECYYQSFEACYPNVLAGNKGFCNLNPAGGAPAAATPLYHRHAKHYAAH